MPLARVKPIECAINSIVNAIAASAVRIGRSPYHFISPVLTLAPMSKDMAPSVSWG